MSSGLLSSRLISSGFQSSQSGGRFDCAVKAAALAGLLILGAGANAARSEPGGPFSVLAGSWSGGGLVKKANGTGERIRCRAVYEPAGSNLGLRLRCASDSYNFDLTSQVTYAGGTISGSWQEATRQVSGPIQGRASGEGRQIQASTQAIGFKADISLNTNGNHQQVRILAPGAEVPEVSVSLEKGGK